MTGELERLYQEKRLTFIEAELDRFANAAVLDIGCGNGRWVTAPIAARYPSFRVKGVDSDAATIAEAAREHALSNLEFSTDIGGGPFDAIIASEVIEHVEDPEGFLQVLRGLLAPGGVIIVTVPNGNGPSEIASTAETALAVTGVLRTVRVPVRLLKGKRPLLPPPDRDWSDTGAVSPHVNFFTFGDMEAMFRRSGLRVTRYAGRMFACGFLWNQLLSVARLARWNIDVADRLSPALISDWMFALAVAEPEAAPSFRRSAIGKARRWLNDKRWSL